MESLKFDDREYYSPFTKFQLMWCDRKYSAVIYCSKTETDAMKSRTLNYITSSLSLY